MPDRPTLVTGASGFAGSHLLDRLSRQPVIGWHRPGRVPPSHFRHVLWRAVDVCDRDAVSAAIAADRPRRVYHLAGLPRVDTAWTDVGPHLQTNVLGTHHVLEAIRRVGQPCRLLIVSSALVYAPQAEPIDETRPLRPSTPYGLSKLAQEQL